MEYYGYEIHTTGGEIYHYGVKGMKWKEHKGGGILGGYYEFINRHLSSKAYANSARKKYKGSRKSKSHVNVTAENWRSATPNMKARVHGGSRGKGVRASW